MKKQIKKQVIRKIDSSTDKHETPSKSTAGASYICKRAAKQLNALKRLGSFFKFYSTKGIYTIICLGKLQLLSNHLAFLFCKRPTQNGKGSRTYTWVCLCRLFVHL